MIQLNDKNANCVDQFLNAVKDTEISAILGAQKAIVENVKNCMGKHIRSRFFYHITKLLNPDVVVPVKVAAAFELFHTATLFHDDVIDEADYRRGKKNLRALYSSKFSILAGDYLICTSMDLVRDIKSWKFVKLFSDLGRNLVSGEMIENSLWLDDIDSKYYHNIHLKTGVFFEIICKTACLINRLSVETAEIVYTYGVLFGRFFQILDDYKDYFWTKDKLGKDTGADFLNGIVTLPLMRLYKNVKESEKRLVSLYFNKPSTENFGVVVDMMRHHNIDKIVEEELREISFNAVKLLNQFDDSIHKNELIKLFDM